MIPQMSIPSLQLTKSQIPFQEGGSVKVRKVIKSTNMKEFSYSPLVHDKCKVAWSPSRLISIMCYHIMQL